MDLAFGKKPPTPDERDLKLKTYLRTQALPTPPKQFGYEVSVPPNKWGMLGNDNAGDCVFAGAAHEHILWTAAGPKTDPVPFSTVDVLRAYSDVTGYVPGREETDQGTIVRDALGYRRTVGMLDAKGNRRKIGAYVALDPGNWDELLIALYLFGAVGIGIEVFDWAMDQFGDGKMWRYQRGGDVVGGHYVPLVARRGTLRCVTWGRVQSLDRTFYERCCDEAWTFVSDDWLRQGKSLRGFSLADLERDLAALAG
jgi:hypothetical protein